MSDGPTAASAAPAPSPAAASAAAPPATPSPALPSQAPAWTPFVQLIFDELNAVDFPHALRSPLRSLASSPNASAAPSDPVRDFFVRQLDAKERDAKEVLDLHVQLFHQYTRIFTNYKENDKGVICCKEDGTELTLNFSQLVEIVEAAFFKHLGKPLASVSSGDIMTRGCYFIGKLAQALFKFENKKMQIYLCSPAGKGLFEELEVLGHGSDGVVFRVLNITSGIFEALKLASDGFDPDTVRKFHEGGEKLRALSQFVDLISESTNLIMLNEKYPHPSIQDRPTATFDCWGPGGTRITGYAGREYPGTLLDWLRGENEDEDRLCACSMLINSVHHLHTVANVRHRDLKPNNVYVDLVDGNFRMMIGDWSHALRTDMLLLQCPHGYSTEEENKRYHAVKDNPEAVKQFLLGPHYAMQEVYAVGVNLYHILSGDLHYPYGFSIAKPYASQGSVFDQQNRIRKYGSEVYEMVAAACALIPEDRPSIGELKAMWDAYMLKLQNEAAESAGAAAAAEPFAEEDEHEPSTYKDPVGASHKRKRT